jgi:hypothetical protein
VESGGEVAPVFVARAVSAEKPTNDQWARTKARARLLLRQARDRVGQLPRRRATSAFEARATERAGQQRWLRWGREAAAHADRFCVGDGAWRGRGMGLRGPCKMTILPFDEYN